MKKTGLLLLLVLLPVLMCTGCMRPTPIDRRLLVQGIGIDWGEEGCRVTLQVYAPGPAGEGEGAAQVYTAAGPAVADCMQTIRRDTGREMFLGGCRLVVLGAGAAGQHCPEVLDYLLSDHQLRPGLPLLFTDGPAGELMAAAGDGAQLSAVQLQQVVEAHSRAGLCPDGTLLTVARGLAGPGQAAALACVAPGEDGAPAVQGAALLAAGGGYSLLDPDSWRGAAYLLGSLDAADYALPYKGGRLRLRVAPVARLLSAGEEGGRPVLQLKLRLNCAVQEYTGGALNWNSAEIAAVGAVARRQVEEELHRSFAALMEQGADVVTLLDNVAKFTPGLARRGAGWLFANARLEADIRVNVTSLGSGARAAA